MVPLGGRKKKTVEHTRLRRQLELASYQLGLYRVLYDAVTSGDQDGVTRSLASIRTWQPSTVGVSRYSVGFRAHCLDLVREIGAAAVARRYGVRLCTVKQWCVRYGVPGQGRIRKRKRRPKGFVPPWTSNDP